MQYVNVERPPVQQLNRALVAHVAELLETPNRVTELIGTQVTRVLVDLVAGLVLAELATLLRAASS
jgi:hypothetical protein